MSQIQRNVGWVGKRPFDIHLAPLKSVLRIRREINSPIKSERILSLTNDRGVIPYEEKGAIGNNVSEDISRYSIVHIGDIVMNSMNVIIGSVGLSKYDGALSPVYYVLQPVNRDQMDMRYFAYHFGMPAFYKQLARIGYGILEHRMRIPWINLQNELMFAPPIAEQKAIADYLDRETARLDALIEAKVRMVDLIAERVEEQVAAILLDINDSHRKDPADIPMDEEVPSGWEVVPLRELLSRITYGFTNPMPTTDDGPLLLTANDIQDGHVAVETSRRTSWDAFRGELSDKSRPRKGDILMTKDGTLGRIAVHDGTPACINQSVALLRAQIGVDPYLLCEILRARPYREALIHNAGGTTIKHLYISRVSKLRIALPAASDRSKCLDSIRTVRDNAEKTLALLDRQIGLLREHREALITAAVTGELEISGVAA